MLKIHNTSLFIYTEIDRGGLRYNLLKEKEKNIQYNLTYSAKQRFQSSSTDTELKFLNFIKINKIPEWTVNDKKSTTFPLFIRSNKYSIGSQGFPRKSPQNNGSTQAILHVGRFKGGRKPFLKDGLGQSYRLLVPWISSVCIVVYFFKFFSSCLSFKISS